MDRSEVIACLRNGLKSRANFVHQLSQLDKTCTEIQAFYHEYDYSPKKKGNGFRTVVRIVHLYLERLHRDFTNGNLALYSDLAQDHETLAQTLAKTLSFALLLRKKGVDFDPTDQTEHDMEFFRQLLAAATELSEPIAGSLGPFHYAGRMSQHMHNAFLALHLLKMPLSTSFRMLTDSRFSAQVIAKHTKSAPMHLVKALSLGPLARGTQYYLSCLASSFSRISWKKVKVPNNSEWGIRVPDYQTPAVVQKVAEPRVRHFRCIIGKAMFRSNDSRSLIIHVHGGAFMTNAPEAFMMISNRLVSRTGIPLLLMEYDKAPEKQFPAGLQDVLDVYLSITSGHPQIEKLLGFAPEKIYMSGDSCGANLALASVFALHEIGKKGGQVRMPSAVMTAYPACMPSFIAVPSYAYMLMDLVLSRGVMCLTGSMYSAIEPDISSIPDWYMRTDMDHESIIRKFSHRMKDPLFNLLAFTEWDAFKETPLSLCSGEMDPLLDQAVMLAKRWAGPVDFAVVPGMPHGYTGFSLDPSLAAEINVYVEQIVRAVGLPV